MRRSVINAVLAGVLALALAPVAGAVTPAERILAKIANDYLQDGRLDPCRYTTQQLQAALSSIGPDYRQYASDLPKAIQSAIEDRAGGACDPATAGGVATPAPAATAPPAAVATAAPSTAAVDPVATTATAPTIGAAPLPDTAPRPADVSSGTGPALDRAAFARPDNRAPAPLIGMGIVALLLLATAAFAVALRRLGFGEGRLAPAYHSWREARWRAGGVWADFRDWLTLGR